MIKQIVVKEPFGYGHEQPVSVVVDGECTHADNESEQIETDYFTRDDNGVDIDTVISTATVCQKCGAQWDEAAKWWDETLESIKFMNQWFDDRQNGKA